MHSPTDCPESQLQELIGPAAQPPTATSGRQNRSLAVALIGGGGGHVSPRTVRVWLGPPARSPGCTPTESSSLPGVGGGPLGGTGAWGRRRNRRPAESPPSPESELLPSEPPPSSPLEAAPPPAGAGPSSSSCSSSLITPSSCKVVRRTAKLRPMMGACRATSNSWTSRATRSSTFWNDAPRASHAIFRIAASRPSLVLQSAERRHAGSRAHKRVRSAARHRQQRGGARETRPGQSPSRLRAAWGALFVPGGMGRADLAAPCEGIAAVRRRGHGWGHPTPTFDETPREQTRAGWRAQQAPAVRPEGSPAGQLAQAVLRSVRFPAREVRGHNVAAGHWGG